MPRLVEISALTARLKLRNCIKREILVYYESIAIPIQFFFWFLLFFKIFQLPYRSFSAFPLFVVCNVKLPY